MKHEPFVILSAERPDLTPEVNAMRSEMLARQLAARDLDFKPVVGVYKGARENSFLVLVESEASNDFDRCMSLAARYGQESILYSDANRFTTRHFPPDTGGGGTEVLGIFRHVAKEIAEAADAYTLDPVSGDYYVAA